MPVSNDMFLTKISPVLALGSITSRCSGTAEIEPILGLSLSLFHETLLWPGTILCACSQDYLVAELVSGAHRSVAYKARIAKEVIMMYTGFSVHEQCLKLKRYII